MPLLRVLCAPLGEHRRIWGPGADDGIIVGTGGRPGAVHRAPAPFDARLRGCRAGHARQPPAARLPRTRRLSRSASY